VTQDSTVSGLVPGGPGSDLDFTVASTATGPQTINGVVVSISNVTKAVGAPVGACTSADFALVQPNIGGAQVIPANGNVTFTSATGGDVANTGASVSMVNSGSNQNGCKGATLQFTYTVN